ncbi:hypothetical protein [Streptomyces sp. WM6378]|uniref:hypothetical protein n=1 Tax=Streptomyces sp. WM6378 TaxID=1415557 RepID=UPI001F1C29C3|nr:hypothetical protein [Streptomyces sp. WM6378]
MISVPPPAGTRAMWLRDGSRGEEYYRRKITEGKTPAEARHALKRRLSNVVYRTMKRDQQRQPAAAA